MRYKFKIKCDTGLKIAKLVEMFTQALKLKYNAEGAIKQRT